MKKTNRIVGKENGRKGKGGMDNRSTEKRMGKENQLIFLIKLRKGKKSICTYLIKNKREREQLIYLVKTRMLCIKC